MTKVALFPWCGVVLKTAEKCELLLEQSGFLTGSTFLPWRSAIIPGDAFTEYLEPWEVGCGDYGLQYSEVWEDTCGVYGLKHEEGWEN